jgi:hypothetical protein
MENFNNSIDERNKVLLENITNAGVKIDFIINRDFEFWAVKCNWCYTIASPNNIPSPEMLAHELLHILVEINGTLPMKELVKILRPDTCRFQIDSLLSINNHLNHCKMLGHYVKAGFEAESFLANNGNVHLLDILTAISFLKTQFDFCKSLKNRYTIALVTELIDLSVSIKYLEIQNHYSSQKTIDLELMYDVLSATDTELFNSIYSELTTWTLSVSYCNYDFYCSLNIALEKLGYPVQESWTAWEREIIV